MGTKRWVDAAFHERWVIFSPQRRIRLGVKPEPWTSILQGAAVLSPPTPLPVEPLPVVWTLKTRCRILTIPYWNRTLGPACNCCQAVHDTLPSLLFWAPIQILLRILLIATRTELDFKAAATLMLPLWSHQIKKADENVLLQFNDYFRDLN